MHRFRSVLCRGTLNCGSSSSNASAAQFLHNSRAWRCLPHPPAPAAVAAPCQFRLFFCRTLILQTVPNVVRIEKLSDSDSGIVDLKLERAEAKNAISKEMLRGLQNAIVEIDNDSSAKVVIVSSSIPRVFCAGADLKERRLMNTSEVEHFVNSLRSTFSSLEALSVPTIAVIEGAALGGGLEMALSCDLRICGEDAAFSMPETGLAIIPGAGGTQRLPRIVGRSLAKELIYTARRFGGREALSMGLVNYCVPTGEAYTKALQIARDINEKGPLAIKMAKKAIDEGMLQVDLASALSIEEECYVQLLHSQDRLEGLAAFAEKRKPKYAGK
ncbi:probable enoyl-CoA hydratase 2, mitochondrial [Dendrobium catenatum]|uniref:1,4-Dihydroxy-2-naphthoyl-CoA synthase n=1 Tax=Dendrobium catenatum TaxID=906689 RepID=A0A2I0V8Z0_9ASPA|nr:probable enoyl-CoA hydratase 2, mitochondrial [Dendrobium catenatum]PKU59861.1 1,4-Dihydroxy-2-naphthoyl-CoA synthase [Dendrobium catenatum]